MTTLNLPVMMLLPMLMLLFLTFLSESRSLMCRDNLNWLLNLNLTLERYWGSRWKVTYQFHADKHSLFHSTIQITFVLIMLKLSGKFFRCNQLLRRGDYLWLQKIGFSFGHWIYFDDCLWEKWKLNSPCRICFSGSCALSL